MATDRRHPGAADHADGVTGDLPWLGPLLDHHLEELLTAIGRNTLLMGDEGSSH